MVYDKFYTNRDVAEHCMFKIKEKVDLSKYEIFLEPSAGNGSFLKLFPENKRIGIDIFPEDKEILKEDFFKFKPENKTYICIGNPPFGRISSIAVKFFNKAAEFSDCIAFILPRTFKRVSIINRLNNKFHIIYEEDIPTGSFTPKMQAKCVFQIWIKKDYPRKEISLDCSTNDFVFCKPSDADFALRAYGGKCGEISKDIPNLAVKSWHFIRSNIKSEILIGRFNQLDYSLSLDTVRQNSIGRKELVDLYNKKYKK